MTLVAAGIDSYLLSSGGELLRLEPPEPYIMGRDDAYKAKHMKAGHNTEPPKVAALTCMAIMNTLPFRPQNPMHVRTDGELYCNELYAAYCISRILGFAIEPDAKLKRDFYWRLLKILKSAEMKSATLLPFVSDVNNGATGTYANHSLTFSDADEMMADTLIAMCELLCAANGIKVCRNWHSVPDLSSVT